MENKKLIHSNGSVGGFDLYKVVQTYMLDLEKRHAINELLHIPEDASFYYEK